MSYESVDIFFTDDTPVATPISGVTVKVMSQDGRIVYQMATSDAQGHVGFLLPAPLTYQVRYYKQQVTFPNPQLLVIEEAPVTNTFDVKGTVFAPPVSSDPRLCMAYGYFRTVTGAPAKFVNMQVIAQFDPIWLEGAGLVTERQSMRTDEDGYVQFTLVRFGQYEVTLAGFEDMTRVVSVPDQPNVNLPDLLWPVVSQVVFDPPPPFNITPGSDFIVTPTVLTSDGRNLGVGLGDVMWSTDNPAIATVGLSSQSLTLRGFATGTTNLVAKRVDTSIIRIPDPGIIGSPAPINVS